MTEHELLTFDSSIRNFSQRVNSQHILQLMRINCVTALSESCRFGIFRPLLEVNSVIWSPHYKQNSDLIERVQRRFTKRLPGYNNYRPTYGTTKDSPY